MTCVPNFWVVKRFNGGPVIIMFKYINNNISLNYQMKTSRIFPFLLCFIVGITACSDELEHIVRQERTALDLNVGIIETSGRSVVEGKVLPEGSSIGITIVDKSGTSYDGQQQNNVRFTASKEGAEQVWNPEKSVMLSGTEATLYGYYPYTPGIDMTAIAVDMTAKDQTDWMFATPITGLSDAQPVAQVGLSHALVNFRLTFIKENYSGKGKVTSISIQGENIAQGGVLNATNGVLSNLTGKGNALTHDVDYLLTESVQDATTFNIMAVPAGNAGDITVSIVVDGHTYSCKTPANRLGSGVALAQILKLSSSELNVVSVNLTDWKTELLPDVEFQHQNEDKYALTVTIGAEPGWEDDGFEMRTVQTCEAKLFSEEFVGLTSKVKCVTLDGNKIVPTSIVQMEEGVHQVKIWFTDETHIPDGIFKNSEITGVFFPEGITTIGDEAFMGSTLEGTLQIPATLTGIGNRAFVNISRLENIVVDTDNPVYDSRNGCNVLMETATDALLAAADNFTLPADVKVLGDYVLNDRYCEERIEIPSTVTYIGDYAFNFYHGELGEVVIPNGCTYIGESAFGNNSWNITSLKLGNELEIIGNGAFQGCFELTGELIIPNSVKKIGDFAFSYTNFTSLQIGTGVETIGAGAFAGNSRMIGEIKLPETLTAIGDEMFNGCSKLTGTVIIPNSVTYIGFSAFDRCSGLTGIVFGDKVEEIGYRAFYRCTGLDGNFTIPSSVKRIGDEAFQNCGIKGNLHFSYETEKVGIGAFLYNEGITGITVDAGNAVYSDGGRANVLFEKSSSTIIMGCNNSTIPSNTLIIGESAFQNCEGLTSVSLPEGLSRIDSYAFDGCSGLTELTIPDNVKSLGYSSFSGCTSVTTMTLGAGIQTIGNYSFTYLESLNVIYSKMKQAPYLDGAFNRVKSAGTLYVPVGATGYDSWMKKSYGNLGYIYWVKVESDQL